MSSENSLRLPIKVMPILGTRPEAVKMAPVILRLKAQPEFFDCKVCVTGQHRAILDQILKEFGVTPDFDLDIMQTGQTLAGITVKALDGVSRILEEEKPDLVLVQGDTNTVPAGALAAAYQKIAVGHVEAGLRTGNKYDPFPEEINRRLMGQLTDLNFAPTQRSADNLKSEGVPDEKIYLTGNTVIDALRQVVSDDDAPASKSDKRLLLVTTHRRENWGQPLEQIALALHDIVEKFPDTHIVLPMHPNPVVRETLKKVLGNHDRVELTEPQEYVDMARLMRQAHLVLTDSGGVQEEAPALGLPVLVLRRTTERPEGIDAGTAKMVGTDREEIVREASKLLSDQSAYDAMSHAANPYGDGQASDRIARSILHWAGHGEKPEDFTV